MSKNIKVDNLYELWIENEEVKLPNSSVLSSSSSYLESRKSEICGKCVSCRDGIPFVKNLVDKFSSGKANSNDLVIFKNIVNNFRSSKCSVGLDTGKNMEVILRNNFDAFQDKVK